MVARLGFFLALLIALSSNANQLPIDPIIAKCTITHQMSQNLPYPNSFDRTNNLVTKTGSFVSAAGEAIIIVGRLLDKNCVPINNGVIRLWQADRSGLISYPPEKSDIKNDGDKNFAGTGTASTDNLGRFLFYTIYPGVNKDLQTTRFINFLAESEKKSLITKAYFDLSSANIDPEYTGIKSFDKSNLILAHSTQNNLYKTYYLDIVMDYAQTNRTY